MINEQINEYEINNIFSYLKINMKVTTDNCINFHLKDIKSSPLYEQLPNKSLYKTKDTICENIISYYKDLLGVTNLDNEITNPELLDGIFKYNLSIVYPQEYDKNEYDSEVLYLISLLDDFWNLINIANGSNDILKKELSSVSLYDVYVYNLIYQSYFNTLKDALLDDDMNIELDGNEENTDTLNGIINYLISKGLETVNVILRKYNYLRNLDDNIDDIDMEGIDMGIFYENGNSNNGFSMNNQFFDIDDLIIDGIEFKDQLNLLICSYRMSSKLYLPYQENDINRINNIINKYKLNINLDELIYKYNEIKISLDEIKELLILFKISN